MSAESTSPLDPEEAFRNAYWYFVESLQTLAADPETQCEAMGDCNVGWEIKDDVAAGRYFVGWSHLTSSQSQAIERLVLALDSVPQEPLVAAQGRAGNLEAMRHVAWGPLRRQAAELLSTLKPFTDANAAHLRSGA